MILLGDADCRLKASLERLQRLTQSYADAMIQIFPERASQLGQALGLDQERVTVSLPHLHFYILYGPEAHGSHACINFRLHRVP